MCHASFVYALVLTEVLVTAACQFLSTIFLSDFANGTFTQRSTSTKVNILNDTSSNGDAFWSMPPAASWTFTELSDSSEAHWGFWHDTGPTFPDLPASRGGGATSQGTPAPWPNASHGSSSHLRQSDSDQHVPRCDNAELCVPVRSDSHQESDLSAVDGLGRTTIHRLYLQITNLGQP
jgi:hypothetical protein